ncbi:MAG: adenylate/guanylate cyclase domain-containing protein [Cyanobacteria bacterium P01_H01_bin.121]
MQEYSLPKGQILVFEPVAAVRELLKNALAVQGYSVVLADSTQRVLKLDSEQRPELVLLSADLPEHKGYELCALLNEQITTQEIPILLLGESSEPCDRERAFAAGCVDYILKPICIEELLVRVRNHLATADLRRRLVEHHLSRLRQTGDTMPLLASLQRRLREQSQKMRLQNDRLQHEIAERLQIEQALREEQAKSDRLLANILPTVIADQLKHERSGVAERFEEATILFADIVDFTPLATRLQALEVVSFLNEIFSEFDRLTESFGLEKIKTIGDAYMVAGGVPVPRTDHAEAVIELAIAMRRAARNFQRDNGKPLILRIGINTGAVVAGVIGLSKFSYDLWGDAVNVASRMESQGLPGRIQVTQATYQRLRHKYRFEQWGAVNVKGKGEMMTYLLVGRR